MSAKFAALLMLLMPVVLCACEPTEETVERTSNQAELAEMAAGAKDQRVRHAAVRKLSDQAELAKIAANAPDWHLRNIAVEKLNDQATIGKIAVEDASLEVRRTAISKLSDQNLLEEVLRRDNLKHRDERIVSLDLIAVDRLSDPSKLIGVVANAGDKRIVEAAINKIDDQSLLLKIASDKQVNCHGRMQALKGLKSPNLLLNLATNDNDSLAGCYGPEASSFLRQSVKSHIFDQNMLGDIAIYTQSDLVREDAINELTDQIVLGRVAIDGNSEFRDQVIEKIKNQEVLGKVACETGDSSARNKITDPEILKTVRIWRRPELTNDQALLGEIATKAPLEDQRNTAAEKLADPEVLAKVGMWIKPDWTAKVTDQALLAKIANETRNDGVREVAFRNLTDQAMLETLMMRHKDWGDWPEQRENEKIYYAACKNIVEQPRLIRIATESAYVLARKCAASKVSDQNILTKIALGDREEAVALAAVERITDPAMLETVAKKEEAHTTVRVAAVGRITREALLSNFALEDPKDGVRLAAIARLNDQNLLEKVAAEGNRLNIRAAAIAKLDDTPRLRQWAAEAPQAAIRQAAVTRVADDEFLLKRLPIERSPAVREAIIASFHGKHALQHVAGAAYHEQDRGRALERLQKETKGAVPEINAGYEAFHQLFDLKDEAALAIAHELSMHSDGDLAGVPDHANVYRQLMAMRFEADNRKLLEFALNGAFDRVRVIAAKKIKDPAVLERLASQSVSLDVLKAVLGRLDDEAALERIASTAAEPAMRVAAEHKAGKPWVQIFKEASSHNASTQKLGDALAAVSLFTVEPDAEDGVQEAALNLIRRGEESRIPEMVDLLKDYGDTRLTEDYLNCGQPDLADAGRAWAREHGFTITTGPGSHRASWGGR